MKIVIDVPEEIMEYIKNNDCLAVAYSDEVAKAIKNGTLLPKGHGRLIDADKLDVGGLYDEDGHLVGYKYITKNDLSYVPTIIGADADKKDN